MNLPGGGAQRSALSKRLQISLAPSSFRERDKPKFDRKSRKGLSRTKQAEFDAECEARAKAAMANLSIGNKRRIEAIAGGAQDEYPFDSNVDGDWEDDDSEPLDQNVEISAEGGEAEQLLEYIGRPTRKATQTWVSRIATANLRWKEQLEALVDAYLKYKYQPIDVEMLEAGSYTLPSVDLFESSEERTFYQIPGSLYTNTTLVMQGYIGPSPRDVRIAFSLRTLEVYRCLRIRQPRVSIQAWLRVICDMDDRPYRKSLWQQFSDAFDVYLQILSALRRRRNEALGRTAPNWRVMHSCPPCQYKLVDDPSLEVSIIGSFDGNSSLKRIKLREGLHGDPRKFHSDYHIPEEEVDLFKDEVKARPSVQDAEARRARADPEPGSAADSDEDDSACASRWKAAMSDSHKRMWAVYRETGVFLSNCRHAIIWWFCDMVKSGELAKYPLVMISRIIRTFAEAVGIGYDIACQFLKTIAKSSLAREAASARLRMAVPAFHGWAHNRACQLDHHPLYITGFGIEDMEQCERTFSSSNGLASITRYASQFHRHQAIDLWARAWDEDKYQELSAFILNNYKQVGQILQDLPEAIRLLQAGKSAEDTDYYRHLDVERQYLAERASAAPEEVWRQEYVELLKKLHEAELVCERLTEIAANPIRAASVSLRGQKLKDDAFEIWHQLILMVQQMERKHNVNVRWTPNTDEWKRASESLTVRKYGKALSKLEGLVVQRLFELAKLGLSGTGYKMRTHINKSLKTRCKAIQSALRSYNTAALAIGRPALQWKDVSTYGSLAEFELLRECRLDIRSQPWADARNRQAANHTLRIARAEEERQRLNVEVRRLATWIRDEEADITAAVERSEQDGNTLLAAELRAYGTRRTRVNNIHRARIQKVYTLPYFTGDRSLGHASERVGDSAIDGTNGLGGIEELEEDEGLDADEDDVLAEQLNALSAFMEDLALVEDVVDDRADM